MGVSAWYFQRRRPGELCRLAQSAVDGFISRGGRLPADADGFVRYAQVIVSLENRRAVAVLRVGFFQYRALEDGTLDRDHYDEIMRTVPAAAFGWLQLSKPPPGVVEAERRFAQRVTSVATRWTSGGCRRPTSVS